MLEGRAAILGQRATGQQKDRSQRRQESESHGPLLRTFEGTVLRRSLFLTARRCLSPSDHIA
jgi:hypothetical protein